MSIDFETKMDVVKKIIEIREKYAKEYLKPDVIRSGSDFDRVHMRVCEEIKQFTKQYNIGIDPQIIFAKQSDFDKYVETGVIREFIVYPDGLL